MDLNEAVNKLLNSYCVLLLPCQKELICIETKSTYYRSVTEPQNEKVIRGAHDGFVESLQVNINLVRNRILNSHLAVKYINLGEESKTRCAILYMGNIANTELVKEIDIRLKNISPDFIMSPGFIEELIVDDPYSLFPQTLNTERPDRVLGNLMEGRVVLLSEGSASAMIFPVTFFSFFQSPDDYNSPNWVLGSFFRLMRFFSFFIAICLPAMYISMVAFNWEVLPISLVIPIKESIENIPYPPLIEAFIMELTIELVREAGIRLPTSIGPVIGIVGGLVIGQAAVEAQLVSNVMVIVVAITATASFVVPNNEMVTSIRFLRFPLMIGAAVMGLLGIILALIVLFMHLCKLESFETPYFSPVSIGRWSDFKDSIFRFPILKMNKRPQELKPQKLSRHSILQRRKPNDSRKE